MTDFFPQNIDSLKKHSPFAERLAASLSDDIEILNTPGGVSVRFRETLIHSSRDPEREAAELARGVRAGSVVFLYGYGLGYHIPPLLDAVGPSGFVLAIELNPALLGAAMILRDQRPILDHPRFHLIFGEREDTVAAEITHHMSRLTQSAGGNLVVKFHPSSLQFIPERFSRIANALEILLMEKRVPAVFGDLEHVNYFFNRDIIENHPGIAALRDRHRRQPALLTSAGPSLDDLLPYLQSAKKRGLLIAAVDTCLPVFARLGLTPDYVFTVDPQEESFRHFSDWLDCVAKLVFASTANTRIVHAWRGEKFSVFKEGHAITENCRKRAEEKGFTRAGGSVSCLGLDCLLQMGCDPVILAGQDCAISGKRFYSSYSKYNELWLDGVSRLRTLTSCHLENPRGHKTVAVQNASDGTSATNQMMYSYMRNIEQIAGAYPQRTLYNLCSHGASLDGLDALGSVRELARILSRR